LTDGRHLIQRHGYFTLAPFSMSRARSSERWHCDSSSQEQPTEKSVWWEAATR